MKRRAALMIAFLALLARPAAALLKNAGSNTSQFLQLGAGARALGMGEAYAAVAEGAEAIYWNPSGLAALRGPHSTYTRSEYLRFFHHDFAAYARPVKILKGAIGVSFSRFSQESLPVVTNANVTIDRFSPHSEVFAFAYAHAFAADDQDQMDRDYFREKWVVPGAYRPLQHEQDVWTGAVLAGFSAKIVNETIYTYNTTAIALDGGLLYRPLDFDDLSIGAVIRNLGSKQKFITESESLPIEFDLGVAYNHAWGESRLLPALDLAVPYYGNPYGKIGVEYVRPAGKNTFVAFRMGFKTLTMSGLSPLSGLTAGIGTQYRKLEVNFGFQPMAEIGEAYRISLGYRW